MTHLRALGILLVLVAAAAPPAQAAFPNHAKVVRKQGDDRVRFVGSAAGKPLTPAASAPGAAARGFLERNAAAFGLGRGSQLRQTRVEEVAGRGSAVRFQQTIDGVEVLGGQFTVQLDAQNRVLSSIGEAEDSTVQTQPKVTAAQAESAAVAATAKHQNVHAARLSTSGTALRVFNDAILGGRGGDRPRLVWETTVSDGDAVRRMVLVDAERGAVAASIDRAPEARNRRICDGNNQPGVGANCATATPALVEGGSTAGKDQEILDAYNFSGATYDYLLQRFGRDSIDGAGMPLISTVRYCEPEQTCPYDNAFWNGRQMTYGQGYAAADDIVAHEFAHGVTEHSSNLLYYFQAGAINESLSDVFGELIDLATQSPNDSDAERWVLGETFQAGGFRNMKDPTLHGDPDRMHSPNWFVSTADSGGVHTNSGVSNKAAYLITDGGNFNGVDVTGLGTEKAAQIYYSVATGFLTSGSDYKDLGLALVQACGNLVGQFGITAADCGEVGDAVQATEMLTDRPEAADMPECPAGQTAAFRYLDELAEGVPGWAPMSNSAANWLYVDFYATSGLYSLFGPTTDEQGNGYVNADYSAAQTAARTIPANAFLRFSHSYEFEAGNDAGGVLRFYDGGVVEVSTNGGSTWVDAVPAASRPAVYDAPLVPSNQLGERFAFAGISAGYRTTVVPLAALAGQNARFRFRIGTDDSIGFNGWFVDDVGVYTCVVPASPDVSTGAASGLTASAANVAGTVDPNGVATSYRFEYGTNGVLDRHTADAAAGGGDAPVVVNAALAGLAASTTYSYRLVATNEVGTTVGETRTFTTTAAGVPSGPTTPVPAPPIVPTPVDPGIAPRLPSTLKGTAKALKRRVKSAKVACTNATTKLTCKVTFPGAKRKRKVSATLKDGARTLAKGSVRRANARGLVTIKGAKGIQKGAYALSVKVGRKTYRFKVTLG